MALSEINPLASNILDLEHIEASAHRAAERESWTQALNCWDALLQEFPDRFVALDGRAKALLELNQFNQAEDVFRKLAKRYPKRARGLHGLAQVAFRRQRFQLVLKHCKLLQERFPQNFFGYLLFGNALIRLNQLSQAEELFKDLIQRYPKRPSAMHGFARVAMHRQQWGLTLERFRNMVATFPDDCTGYFGQANALSKMGDFDAAEIVLQSVVQQNVVQVPISKQLSVFKKLVDNAYNTQRWNFAISQIEAYILSNTALLLELSQENSAFKLIDQTINLLLDSYKLTTVENLLAVLHQQSAEPGIVAMWRSRLTWQQGQYDIANQLCLNALTKYPNAAEHLNLQLIKYAKQSFELAKLTALCQKITPSGKHVYLGAAILDSFALIRLGRTDSAQTVLQKAITWHPNKPTLYASLAEIFYFCYKDFKRTIEICDQALCHGVGDERIYAYRALALADLGKTNKALRFLDQYLTNHAESHLVEMAQSQVARQHQDYQKSLAMVNQWLSAGDFAPIQSTGKCCELNVQYLHCTPGYTVSTDELVSVIMTTYMWDAFLPTAISSILNQTYQNLELIVVDDCSSDNTFERLQEISQTDSRIRLVRNAHNVGTYVARNHGLMISSGKYLAFMDSDDWLHPQTIERQIENLQVSKTLAVICGFFRVDEHSNVEFKPEGPSGQASITLCFKKDPVFNKLGYFDAVRTGADVEYFRRLQCVFGSQSVKRLKFPLLVSSRHSASITGGSSELGLAWYGPRADDHRYMASYRQWHGRIVHENFEPYLSHPLLQRKFSAPGAMLP